MSKKEEKVRVIWHGEWSDPEIAVRVSKNRINFYNYYDVEEWLDQELYPNGFADIEDDKTFEDEVLCATYDLVPSEKMWLSRYTWEWEPAREQDLTHGWCGALDHRESDEEKVFRTTSEALADALDELCYTGYLYIYNSESKIVFCAKIAAGTILKDYTK